MFLWLARSWIKVVPHFRTEPLFPEPNKKTEGKGILPPQKEILGKNKWFEDLNDVNALIDEMLDSFVTEKIEWCYKS